MKMALEVIILPVADADRAKAFYKKLGFREDIDADRGDYRVIQFTPPGSATSIIFGKGITSTEPGSIQSLVLVVDDIEAAHAELANKGIEVTEVFHNARGLFYHADKKITDPGPAPDHASYRSFTAFSDPDGNGWVVQEIKQRLPGR